MDFQLLNEPQFRFHGHTFPSRLSIVAQGTIEIGDAKRFEAFLQKAGRDQYGNITVYLNSLGGDVAEAMKFVPLIDQFEITAIIRDGDICASACASILFITARIHFIENGGKLGLHSCVSKDKYKIPLDLCNEAISNNAKHHGTGHNNILAFMDRTNYSNNNIHWFDNKGAILFGLYGPPNYDPTLAIPSFDCSKKITKVEKIICNNPQLSRYDASAAHIYKLLKKMRLNKTLIDLLIKERKNWLIHRDSCVADNCIYKSYSEWRNKLRGYYTALKIIESAEKINRIDPNKKYSELVLIDQLMRLCRDTDYCEKLEIPEYSYDLFNDNLALHLIDSIHSGRLNATSDCLFTELCDTSIRTIDIIDIYHRYNSTLPDLSQ